MGIVEMIGNGKKDEGRDYEEFDLKLGAVRKGSGYER